MFKHPYISTAWPGSALLTLRGTLLCLAAGVAFSVSPVLIQVAYATARPSPACSPGATSPRPCCSSDRRPQDAPRSRQGRSRRIRSRAVVYALDSALFFGSLERTSAPLASLVHYAHLVLVVGVAAMIGRERLDAPAAPRARRDLRRRGARRRRRRRTPTSSASGWRSAPPLPTPSTSCSPTGSCATPTPIALAASSRRAPQRRSSSRAACSARSAPSAAPPGSPASSARRSSAPSSRSRRSSRACGSSARRLPRCS